MHSTPLPARKPPKSTMAHLATGSIAALVALIVGGLSFEAVRANQAEAAATDVAATYVSPVTYTPPPEPIKAAFVGDSYTTGSGTTSRSKRWTTVLSNERGWLELNYGIGGTNYGTAGKQSIGKAYVDHLTDLIISQPDIVFVSSAGNGIQEDQTEAINETFQKLREGLPNAQIYATSPYTRYGWYTKRSEEFGEQIKSAVEAVDGVYLDLDNPLGEYPEALAEDDIHPDDFGYQVIADTVDEQLP